MDILKEYITIGEFLKECVDIIKDNPQAKPLIIVFDSIGGGFQRGTINIIGWRKLDDKPTQTNRHKCNCDSKDLFAYGCKCGGI